MKYPNDRTPNPVITLAGLSEHGKRIVKNNGNKWRIINRKNKVRFCDDIGPWLMIVPDIHGDTSEATRWVHSLFDGDFKVMP